MESTDNRCKLATRFTSAHVANISIDVIYIYIKRFSKIFHFERFLIIIIIIILGLYFIPDSSTFVILLFITMFALDIELTFESEDSNIIGDLCFIHRLGILLSNVIIFLFKPTSLNRVFRL